MLELFAPAYQLSG